jgi:RHS repeat-associated protein
MTFDDNGNLVTLTDATGTSSYTWDARNRLTGLSGPVTSAQFAYDSHGRRAQKTLAGVTTQFHYDGLDVVRDIGGTGDAAYLRTLTIDETLARTDGEDALAYLADALGSAVALTDPTGAPAITYTYAPFGEVSAAGAPSTNPVQYTGRESDLPGLFYYRSRYYLPLAARFLSEDPLAAASETLNRYEYVDNAPLDAIDPLGLFTIVVTEYGTRAAPTWGANITLYADNGTVLAVVRGSSWPDPQEKNPGIQEGVYYAKYGKHAHKGNPGVQLFPRLSIPTIGPNPVQGDKQFATGINIHCGGTKSRGSEGCITIEGGAKQSQCKKFFGQLDKLKKRESGNVILLRGFEPNP